MHCILLHLDLLWAHRWPGRPLNMIIVPGQTTVFVPSQIMTERTGARRKPWPARLSAPLTNKLSTYNTTTVAVAPSSAPPIGRSVGRERSCSSPRRRGTCYRPPTSHLHLFPWRAAGSLGRPPGAPPFLLFFLLATCEPTHHPSFLSPPRTSQPPSRHRPLSCFVSHHAMTIRPPSPLSSPYRQIARLPICRPANFEPLDPGLPRCLSWSEKADIHTYEDTYMHPAGAATRDKYSRVHATTRYVLLPRCVPGLVGWRCDVGILTYAAARLGPASICLLDDGHRLIRPACLDVPVACLVAGRAGGRHM
ncbi:hypothetical protein F4780DRAFT_58121 [Xylariomycetidae sp. FL0641]|nr:hypothetical protein F4780DRAFT_58121 [Xylariomycetidae sp. FL0641]